MSVEFGLLGPLVVGVDGRPVTVGAPQTRAVLALLLTNANQVVSVSRLIESLWPRVRPPTTARETVQYYVHRLRKALTPEHAGILVTHSTGYLLQVGPGERDIDRFEVLVAQADTASAQGDLAGAWERLGVGLGLWRGPALADFAEAGWAQPEIARLTERRTGAAEQRLEVGLGLGRYAEVIGELEALVAQHPLREGLRVLLMLALHRSGRTAEALVAYQTARTAFVEELGIEPGPELVGVQQQILNQDPALQGLALQGLVGGVRSSQPPPVPPPRGSASEVRAGLPAGPPPASVARLLAADAPACAVGPARPVPLEREERRPVSLVVVTHLPPAGSSDPEDLRRADAARLRALHQVAGRYRGVVHPLGRLPEGVVAFGTQTAREDDPERAVRAALEITAQVPAVCCCVATGLAITPLSAEPGGLPLLWEAEGLLAADGSMRVLVTTEVYQHTRGVIDYQPTTSSGVWQAIGPRARPGLVPAGLAGVGLVEREVELGWLHDRYRRLLRDPWAQLVTVLGAPGIGKTRLVAELGRAVEADPELVAWRVGRPAPAGHEDGGVFWALAEITAAEAGIQPDDPAERIASRLTQTVTATLGETAAAGAVTDALRVLLRLQPAGDLDQAGLFARWRQFITGLARRRPLVVVIEDLHRADDAMLDFLAELLARPARLPLLVVATARTELLARRPAWPGHSRHALTLELAPLSPQGAEVLLKAFTDALGVSLPEARRKEVLTAAGGNPLFLAESVRMCSDWPGTEVPLMPASLKQLITARIDTPTSADRFVLEALAVVGEIDHATDLDLLAQLTSQPLEEVTAALARLEHHHLLHATHPLPGTAETPGYQFTHALIRDAAYERLLRADRARLHQQAAGWYALHPGGRVEHHAHHAHRALLLTRAADLDEGDLAAQAVAALETAGDAAAGLTATATAMRYYQQATDLLDPATTDPVQRQTQARLSFQRAELARLTGDATAEQQLTLAAELYAQLGDAAGATRARGVIGLLHATQATPPPTLAQPPADALLARAFQAAVQMAAWDNHGAVAVGGEVMAQAEQTGRWDAWARAAGARGFALARLGELEEGVGLWREAIRVLEHDLGSPSDRLEARYARAGLAVLAQWRGTLDQLAVSVQPAAAESVWDQTVLAADHYHAGRWPAALQLLEWVLQPDHAAQLTMLAGWAHTLRGRIRLGRGDISGALADAHAGVAAAARTGHPQDGDRHWRHIALGLLARAQTTSGDPDAARVTLTSLCDDLRADATGSGVTPDAVVALVDQGLPASLLPDGLIPTRWDGAITAMAARDYPTAAAGYTRLGAHADAADAHLRAATQYLGTGHPDQARAALDAAAAFYRHADAAGSLGEVTRLQTVD